MNQQLMTVIHPVANLLYQPQTQPNINLPTSDVINPQQITQILLGEHVIAHEQCIDDQNQQWYFVSTMQQAFFQDSVGWHGFPGWIQAKDLIEVSNFLPHNIVIHKKLAPLFDQYHQKVMTLSLGTRLYAVEKKDEQFKVILPNQKTAFINCADTYEIHSAVQESEMQLRANILATAQQFIGDWYSWGGRSSQCDDFEISSVDCSALVHLSFLAHGLQIPRMSHEQFLKSEKILHCADLQPCDFIYFVSITKHSTRMDHVMIYLGNDQILESTYADDHKVRIVSFQERMGKSCNFIKHGDKIIWNDEEFFVYFGSLLANKPFIQQLRNDALKNVY